MPKVISLELNEINFDFVEHYIAAGKLPAFKALLAKYQLFETEAQEEYPNLEPWIQWPTIYSGRTYGEHGIFRLGDIVHHGHVQIWEYLESRGKKVGAISPMNAANRCEAPAFFLPDPWTETAITADEGTAQLYGILKRYVNDNASDERSMVAVAKDLLPRLVSTMSLGSLPEYARIVMKSVKHKWARAAFLDRLLADVFVAQVKTHDVDFASLFLNAGAHIQHHHMYDSDVYDGPSSNPSWYSSAADNDADPLLFIYQTYDDILGDFMKMPDWRLMITTGISQRPNTREHYQYRMVDHQAFLEHLGLKDFIVVPRMSRDFRLEFPDAAAASRGVDLLGQVTCGGKPLFTIEERAHDLFCQVGYYGRPDQLAHVAVGGRTIDASSSLVLVSIENGLHRPIGFHVDTHCLKTSDQPIRMPLPEVFNQIATAVLGEGAAASNDRHVA